MNDKYESLLKQFNSALERLREVLAMEKNIIVRDSAIQRFEFTFELAWKTMRAYLLGKGAKDINFPKDVIRAAFLARLIPNDPRWLDMVDTRNKTSHLYKESMAEEVYSELNIYLPLFEELLKILQ